MHHKDFVKYAFCHCNMRDNCRQEEFYNFLMKVLMILNEVLENKKNTETGEVCECSGKIGKDGCIDSQDYT